MKEIYRVLKPGGILYIRDHGKDWMYSAHKLDIEELLKKDFKLVFKPNLKDKLEIHGIPRIWKKFE